MKNFSDGTPVIKKLKKRERCWYYGYKGGCRKGANCRYLHINVKGSKQSKAPIFVKNQLTTTSLRARNITPRSPNHYVQETIHLANSYLQSPAVFANQSTPFSMTPHNYLYSSPYQPQTVENNNNNNNNDNTSSRTQSRSDKDSNSVEDSGSHTPLFPSRSRSPLIFRQEKIHSEASNVAILKNDIMAPGTPDQIVEIELEKVQTEKTCFEFKVQSTYVILFFVLLLLFITIFVPVLMWNNKMLEIVQSVENEIISGYNYFKDTVFAAMVNGVIGAKMILSNTYFDAVYTAQGIGDGVVMLFEKSEKFAFRINDQVDSFFNDVIIKSVKDTWVTRVSEGVSLDKGLVYVENKRSQPDRYPEQFVNDLETIIKDLVESNIRNDFFEFKEVGFENNELSGHVGVIAVKRYAYRREFDIAFSITSTDVTIQSKNCYKRLLGLSDCNIDITSRHVRKKLIQYFQKELILDLKADYPGRINVIYDNEDAANDSINHEEL